MGRIEKLFGAKQTGILNVYCTAGFPKLDDTLHILESLQKNDADMIEIGMPYSDPLADGPVIQASSTIALANGMSIEKLFQQLKDVRNKIHIPIILMGYMNPVLQYGFERFCSDAAEVGIDGLILPDLPEHEFEMEYKKIIKKHALDFIFLITPETSEQRIRNLDNLSSGFLYAVSSSSTTGGKTNFETVEIYLKRLKSYQLKNPILVGFGIKNKQTFEIACKYTNGAIIGSAYINVLQNAENIEDATANFLSEIIK